MRKEIGTKFGNGSFISGNAKVVRNINRAVILNLIREKQPISRVKISKLSGLNKSTVSSIVAGLLEDGLIYQETHVNQLMGRNPINLCLKLGTRFVGAINIDSPTTKIAIVELNGNIKESTILETETDSPELFVSRCVEKLFFLRDKMQIRHLEGIGLSVAGIADPTTARVLYAPRLGWENFELGKAFKALCPEEGTISIDNDARASALAELWYGNHKLDLTNFVFLSVGPGIGTGIVMNKNLIYGSSYAAGEFGHMTLFEGGELCTCGNHGCWEAYASDRATVRRYLAKRQQDQAIFNDAILQEIIDKAKIDDAIARDILLQTGYYLGMGIASIIKVLDPEAVIIGGHITNTWPIIYPEIMQALSRRAFSGKKINIFPTSLLSDSTLVGAATFAIREFFNDFKITR